MILKNCFRFCSLSLNSLSTVELYIFHFIGFKTGNLAIMSTSFVFWGQIRCSTSFERFLIFIQMVSSFKTLSRKLFAFLNLLHLFFCLQILYVARSWSDISISATSQYPEWLYGANGSASNSWLEGYVFISLLGLEDKTCFWSSTANLRQKFLKK